MSQHWLDANASRLTAEILRDFCSLSVTLEEQCARFDSAGNLSFGVLKELLGDMMDKGLLWRLKDTAHHILRDDPARTPDSRLLDWAIGYIFHETMKLMEDTHQRQYYTPRLLAFVNDNPAAEHDAVAQDFTQMVMDTQHDMRRGVERIRKLLAHARRFFHRCYSRQAENRHIARLLHDREDLVRKAFAEEYDLLVASIYGPAPERLYLLAAESLTEAGREEQAAEARAKAAALSSGSGAA